MDQTTHNVHRANWLTIITLPVRHGLYLWSYSFFQPIVKFLSAHSDAESSIGRLRIINGET